MAEQAQQAEKPAKKGGKVPLFAVIGVILVLNLLLVGKVFIFTGGKGKPAAKKPPEIGAKVQLDEFLVNLAGGGDHYLKLQIALGLRKDMTEDKVKEDTAPIRDAVLGVLTNKSLDDLTTEKGREGLKQELKDSINKELSEGKDGKDDKEEKVIKIYFVSFATQ